MGPENDAALGTAARLEVSVDDPDDDATNVTFYLREISDADDFTVVVLPDTQNYTRESPNWEQYYYNQTQWIRDHRVDYNIAAVIHNGDIVDAGDEIEYQWTVADQAMATLETPESGLPEGIPYGVCVGNHDNTFALGKTVLFNKYFGVSRFANRTYYGGHYARANDENWFSFSVGDVEFVVVNLQYRKDAAEVDPAVLDWARSIFEMHPEAFGIVNSHWLVTAEAGFSPLGTALYEKLKGLSNVHLMTCGHISAEARREDEFQGHHIYSMLADYQNLYLGTSDYQGGAGYLRLWEFSPANNELTVRSYSPTLDDWMTDDDSEFTLPVDLRGTTSGFAEVAQTQAKASTFTDVTGLKPGTTYEWYADVSDCGDSVSTLVRRFTTSM